jgi:hypothetical protein
LSRGEADHQTRLDPGLNRLVQEDSMNASVDVSASVVLAELNCLLPTRKQPRGSRTAVARFVPNTAVPHAPPGAPDRECNASRTIVFHNTH